MSDTDFQSIFDSDEDGLLDTPEKAPKLTSTDRLERSFLEIVEFWRARKIAADWDDTLLAAEVQKFIERWNAFKA